jgi:NAD(P)-dependent dehydrogenase (short-subunit alcohol dehydrogenase family)
MSTERKVAVITGTSQGIGAALVKAYRDRNYRVVATARSVKPSSDADVLVVPGDIGDRKTAERAISEGVARFGWIDTLVNNAAILGVNIAGFFHITQLAVAEMEKQGSGHVVQVTTSLVDHAISGIPSVLASLTKGGLNAAAPWFRSTHRQPGRTLEWRESVAVPSTGLCRLRELCGSWLPSRVPARGSPRTRAPFRAACGLSSI